jgi:asparaginyl-tRNA synthetase
VGVYDEPIFITNFPSELKAFYMKDEENVDLLLPGVGECIGGSMRETDYDKLLNKSQHLDQSQYYWYTDQRKYGSCPHGGYGIGLERFLCWLLGRTTVKEVCLFPRYEGRCMP